MNKIGGRANVWLLVGAAAVVAGFFGSDYGKDGQREKAGSR